MGNGISCAGSIIGKESSTQHDSSVVFYGLTTYNKIHLSQFLKACQVAFGKMLLRKYEPRSLSQFELSKSVKGGRCP